MSVTFCGALVNMRQDWDIM